MGLRAVEAAQLRYGKNAMRPGTIGSVFDLFGRVLVADREGAARAKLIATGVAYFTRAMLVTSKITRADIDNVLASVHEMSAKLQACMAVANSLPLKDRQFLQAGGEARLARLSQYERKRIAELIDGFLDQHPESRALIEAQV